MVDRWHRNPAVDLETAIRNDAMKYKDSPLSQDYVASLLAQIRNK